MHYQQLLPIVNNINKFFGADLYFIYTLRNTQKVSYVLKWFLINRVKCEMTFKKALYNDLINMVLKIFKFKIHITEENDQPAVMTHSHSSI